MGAAFTDSVVVGCLLSYLPSDFEEKLKQADLIEVYPDLYQRSVVSVVTDDGLRTEAWMYHRHPPQLSSNAIRIPSGDWLNRSDTSDSKQDSTRRNILGGSPSEVAISKAREGAPNIRPSPPK